MLPDTADIFIFALSFIALCYFAAAAGNATSDEGCENEPYGLSKVFTGNAAIYLITLGFFVFWGTLRMSAIGFWIILIYLCALKLTVVCFALGYSREGKSLPLVELFGKALGWLVLPARLVLKAFNLSEKQLVTEKEVLSLVDDVEEQELIDESQKEMITNIFELDDVTAFDIMTHRTELVSVEEQTAVGEVIKIALEKGFSRMPVYKKTLDNVSGIVYAKDLLRLVGDSCNTSEPVLKYTRSAMFVPEGRRARDLLVDFKLKRTQLAIVVDEYGGTAGIVSMEDILEEIVGNIQDEYDNEDELLVAQGDGFIADGSLDLDEVFDAFDMQMPEAPESEFDSVGGLITDTLGRIPLPGEDINISYCGIKFTVIEVGERRIVKVKCMRIINEPEGTEEGISG